MYTTFTTLTLKVYLKLFFNKVKSGTIYPNLVVKMSFNATEHFGSIKNLSHTNNFLFHKRFFIVKKMIKNKKEMVL